ncbi:MAG: hypothetical protein H6738_15290 [Alphaproteobacteria bacterium]|nr:hypothetical protein [Alphaproteobacteria bacterium]MCB9698142.1 hypothetical protein [Alphaproteobacteria bacterium]
MILLAFACARPVALDVPSTPSHSAAPEPTVTPGTVDLVDAAAWTVLDPADDPGGGLDGTPCTPLDYGPEDAGFEVRTDACDGAVFEQPLLAGLAVGDRVGVGVLHLDLWSADPDATAELSLWLGDEPLWTVVLSMPREAGVVDDEVLSPLAVEVGSPIRFRVQNHGRNSYELAWVRRLSAAR